MDTPTHRYMSIAKDIKMREQCTGSSKQFPYCIPNKAAFAIALKGNVDLNSETKRMKLIISQRSEPDWGVEDQLNEKPIFMKMTSQIVDLTPGRNYTILKFEKSSAVPKNNFLASNKWTKSW